MSGTQPIPGSRRAEDPVVVGAVEEKSVVVRTGVDGHGHAGAAGDLGGAVVELGRDGELVGAGPAGGDGRRADGGDSAGEVGGEVDLAGRHIEVAGERVGAGEAALGAEGEGDQVEAVRGECPGEGRGCAGVAADHGVGDLDAGVAAGGDRRQ